jgi:hypothetical protein
MTYSDIYNLLTTTTSITLDNNASMTKNELAESTYAHSPGWWFQSHDPTCCKTQVLDWGSVLDKIHDVTSPQIPPGSLFDTLRPPSLTCVGDFINFNHTTAAHPADTDDQGSLSTIDFGQVLGDYLEDLVSPVNYDVRSIGIDSDPARLTKLGAMADTGANVCMQKDDTGLVNIQEI